MPDGELHFTIGATELGEALNLNATIRVTALECGFNVLDRHTTSASRRSAGEYPAIQTSESCGSVVRVLSLVEGAAIQVATSGT